MKCYGCGEGLDEGGKSITVDGHDYCTQACADKYADKAKPDVRMMAAVAFADRKSTRLNSSHLKLSRMPSSA